MEERIREGAIDFYVGVAPSQKPATGFLQEKLFDNARVIVGRTGHPLIGATSLAQLTQARWAMSGATFADARFADLFRKHKIAVPTQLTFGSNILGQMVFVLNSDMLAMVPRQWIDFAPLKGLIQRIPIRESIDSPSIVMIRRTALPLTPAAEYFCDLVRRVSGRMPSPQPTRVKPAAKVAPKRTDPDRRSTG